MKYKPLTLTNSLKAQQKDNIFISAQPTVEQIQYLRKQGFAAVINLRTPQEDIGFDEPKIVRGSGLKYIHVPVQLEDGKLSDTDFKKIEHALGENSKGRVLLHCKSGKRARMFVDRLYTE